ncbi:MAG: holo-ACP synthase [Alkalimonas sp.]|nr:holo-ACP synthase [Alkalimonas sp.]
MAIAGLGTDIVQLSRIERSLTRSPKLAERVLTPTELSDFIGHAEPARFLAKRFAAKEAAAKALGTGIGRGVSWQQFQIDHDALGAPLLRCNGYSLELLQQRGIQHCWLSISDEQDYACATVILER